MVVLTQTLFAWAICIFLVGSQGLVFFIGLRVCPWLIVALTQTLFVWAVSFILLDHEGKWF